MVRPVTNHELDALLSDAGYATAHGGFARQVNHAVSGTACYDAASVYWWLRGRRPDPAARAAIAAILARKIGRTVSDDDLGFDHDAALGLIYPGAPGETIADVTTLWRLVVRRRDLLAATPFVTSAAVHAALAWRYDPADPDWSHTGPRTVTAADVDALNLYAAGLADLDRRHGGSTQTRLLLADFLHRQVDPMLHASYTDVVGRALMNAAAGLAGQLAYMAYDAGEHGAAQRHYTTALRLSKAGNDRLYGAHVLANLATQAIYLGHGAEAVRLARAAIDGAGRAPATVRARLYTTEACALAITGDRDSCTKAPSWAGYFSPAHFAGTAARCYRDLGLFSQALRHGPAALDLAADSTRTGVLHNALIATVHADRGDLHAACDFGDHALRESPSVQSGRVRQRLTELAVQLRQHRTAPVVANLLERHHTALATG
jgi:tetratricopeptide (TPR) repeat protein